MFSRAVRRPCPCRRATTSGRPASDEQAPPGEQLGQIGPDGVGIEVLVDRRTARCRSAPPTSTTASGVPSATRPPATTSRRSSVPATGRADDVLHLHRLEHHHDGAGRHLRSPTGTGSSATVPWSGASRRDLLARCDVPSPAPSAGPASVARHRAQAAPSGRWTARPPWPRWRPHARRRPSAVAAEAAARAVVRTPVSPGVQKAWTPGVERAKRTPRRHGRRIGAGLVPGVGGGGPAGPRAGRRGLDGHHPDVVLGGVRQQRLGVPAVVGVGPQPGIDGEHHGVEVVAPQGLEMGGRAPCARGR